MNVNPSCWRALALISALSFHNALAAPPTPAEQVDAIQAVFGRHAGLRATHAKGICAAARFVPASQAPAFVRASLFSEQEVPAVVRFSLGGGNPNASDKSRTPRGIAVRMQGKSDNYDLVMLSEPVAIAATPESFVSFMLARVPDPVTKQPDPEKIQRHNARFPDGARQPALLAKHAAPQSYATTPYFGGHAFRFVSPTGQATWARVSLEPVAGTHYLSNEQEDTMPGDFLRQELAERLRSGPAAFVLQAQPAAPGDSLTDPTLQWSKQGPPRVELGRLEVTALADASTCDPVMFVPTLLPAGIEPSDDPILRVRAAAYAVSLQRRNQR